MTLTFEPERHIYRVDGVAVSSVSQRGKEYGFLDDRFYKRNPNAAPKGTLIHSGVENINNGILDVEDFEGTTHEGYFKAYARFLSDTQFKADFNECLVYNPILQECGTVDMIGEYQGRPTIMDLKTGVKSKFHGMQVNAYRLAVKYSSSFYRLTETEESPGILLCEPYENPFYGKSLAMRILYIAENGKYKIEGEYKKTTFDNPVYENAWIGARNSKVWREL